MSQGVSVPRVSSGLPWWLWLLLLLVTAGVVGGLIFSVVPENPQEVFRTAVEAGRSGRIQELRSGIARLERYPEFQEHRKLLEGMQAVADMRDPKAIELLEEVSDNPELSGYALSSVALAYRRTGQLVKCVSALQTAVDSNPDAVQPRLELADMYLQLGGLKLAVKEVEAVLKADPDNPDALATLGTAYWEMRDFQAAADRLGGSLKTPGQLSAATPGVIERYLKSVVALKDLDALSNFGSEHASLVTDDELRAEILLLQGDTTGLQGMIDKMKEFGGEAPGVTKLKAMQALQNDEAEKAFQLLTGLTTIIPRDAGIWEMLRDAAIKLDRTQIAEIAQQNVDGLNEIEEQYRQVASQETGQVDQIDPLVKLGDLAMAVGQYELVYLWYQRASAIDPSLAEAALEKRREMYTVQKALVPLPRTRADDDPAADDAAADDPAGDKPDNNDAPPAANAVDATETPATETPATETPASQEPDTETPASQEPDTETPAKEQPNDVPATDDAVKDSASDDASPQVDEATNNPDKPAAVDDPAAKEATGEEPADEA